MNEMMQQLAQTPNFLAKVQTLMADQMGKKLRVRTGEKSVKVGTVVEIEPSHWSGNGSRRALCFKVTLEGGFTKDHQIVYLSEFRN